MELDRDAIVQVFLAEAEEQLARMEEGLLALEAAPDDPDLVDGIFREAHTIKGNAASLGFGAIGEVAHVLEDVLDRLRQGALEATPGVTSRLLTVVDALRELFRAAGAGRDELGPEHQALVARLAAEADAHALAPRAAVGRRAGASRRTDAAAPRTLRVDVAKLDRLMDLAGEIAIVRGRVRQMLEGRGLAEILEAHGDSDRSFLDLQDLILRARMVPVGPAFRPYARTVRDVAAARGKQARLVIEGGDVELDTSLIEHLRDPLTHMIRNAVDHGIEAPSAREARGKDACGTVRLRALREAGTIVIELSDDGAGLDRACVAERARERGLAAGGERLGDADAFRLIFEPGFSTARTVTDLSGRGVGLDVVRKNVEALRGSVAVASREGEGTTFTIRLPLTLAIIDGFGIVAGDETFIVPTEAVVECQELPRMGDESAAYTVIRLRGEALPCLRLRHHFGRPGPRSGREDVVVVRHERGHAGLIVDGLLGERQTVIKPLGPLFRNLPGIAGSAILGSGRVALVLDVAGLLRGALDPSNPTHFPGALAASEVTSR